MIEMPHKVLFDNVEKNISNDSVEFCKVSFEYVLSPDLQRITKELFDRKIEELRRKENYFNEEKVRFCKISILEGRIEVLAQKITYEDYLRTNYMLDESFDGRKLKKQIANPDELANPVGLELMVLSSDNKLIFQRRSDTVDMEKGKICSSASGSLRFSELPEKKSFSLAEVNIFKEVKEELNLNATEFYDFNFLGISYNQDYGIKPEMHFLFKSKLKAGEIINRAKQSVDSWEFSELFTIDAENELLSFLKKQRNFIAIDTIACLYFVRKYFGI